MYREDAWMVYWRGYKHACADVARERVDVSDVKSIREQAQTGFRADGFGRLHRRDGDDE